MSYLKNSAIKGRELVKFRIADLNVSLTFNEDWDIDKLLPNFMPFRIDNNEIEEETCIVEIVEDKLQFSESEAQLLSDISIVWGDRFTFWETSDCYWTVVEGARLHGDRWIMRSSKEFKFNRIQTGALDVDFGSLISWFCMVAFAQSSLNHDSVLIHSSVVFNQEAAYGFLGKSGTGKSTHSRLWLNYLEGYELLNDDNPAIRIMPNGKVWVYGTPWSGKTPCYKNKKSELKGLVRLCQAPFNKFEKKENKEALIALLPSCSAIRWNKGLYSKLVDLLVGVIRTVSIGELNCLPNEEAAVLCNEELLNYKLSV